MDIERHGDEFAIRHGGKLVRPRFTSEREAWSWADYNIDDQVFDKPNTFAPPIEYENTDG